MDYYSIWPFFACMALLLALVATPAFAAVDAPPNSHPGRLATLDGLRGFLALAVLFQHGAIYHRFLLDGRWELPPSRFYVLLGEVGVSMFFMVTGYLFWSRLVAESGRPAWLRLYIGRIFRIGPLYLAAVAAMLAIIFAMQGLQLNVTWGRLVSQVGTWLALGLVPGWDVNGYAHTGLVLAGVTWTLRYEWLFYLSLPATAFAAARGWTHLPFAAAGLAGCLLWKIALDLPTGARSDQIYAAMFFAGMTCASLHARGLIASWSDRAASVTVSVLLVVAFTVPSTTHTAKAVILLGTIFYLITSGCTLWGLLVSRPARRLGDISYGLYLLQGLVLFVVLWLPPLRAAALASPAHHWSLMLLCAALLITVATATHVWIERPGIALGKRVAAALGQSAGTSKPSPHGAPASPHLPI